jgi:hypothetical protein
MLKYCLIENPLLKDGKSFIALARSSKTVDLDQFMNDMVDEGTGLTKPQALAYFEKMIQLTVKYLQQGYFINTPLFRYRASISGVFDGKNDTFDPARHEIKLSSTAGSRIRNLNLTVDPNKVSVSKTSPQIFCFIDSATDESNTTGTSGGIAKIQGVNLKFDKTDLKQGIFFVSVANPETEVRASVYSGIRPSEIHISVPVLEAGEYKVVIRNMTANNKEMVSGTLEATILF